MHIAVMTELFKLAVETTSKLPDELQDEIAQAMLSLAGEQLPPIGLTAEDEASLAESLAQSARGEYASDEEISAIWAKYDL